MRRLIAGGRFKIRCLCCTTWVAGAAGRFDVPAGYHIIDGVPSVLTSSGWRYNFTGGRAIEVTLRGERRPAFAVLTAEPREVATVYERLILELGTKQARRRLGLRFNVDRAPTLSELQDAIERSGLSIVGVYDQPPEH